MAIFKRKPSAKSGVDTSDLAPPNPYLAARREWDERYGDLIARAKNWRLVALLLALALLMAVGGLVAMGMQSRVQPYIVEVDGLGRQVGGGFAQAIPIADDRLKRATVARWVNDLRSVVSDGVVQRQMIDRVYAHIAQGSVAQTQISDFYKSDPPQKRAASQIVTAEVVAVYPSSPMTYEVEWVETIRNLQGAIESQQRWRASLTLAVNPPTDEVLAQVNPLGIYVTVVSWSKVLK